jgi:hypothetical protein
MKKGEIMVREGEITAQELTEKISGQIKLKIRVLLLASTLIVAIAFGLSFYYSLISSEVAIVKQIPELETVTEKMKSMLIINTFAVILIIVASLYILSILVTTNMFRPVGLAQKGLISLANNTFPHVGEFGSGQGPFADFNKNLAEAVENIREKQSSEIEELKQCMTLLSANDNREAGRKLEKLIQEKSNYLGNHGDMERDSKDKSDEKDVFMQPS